MLIVEYLSSSFHRFLPDLADQAQLKSRFLITLNGPSAAELPALIREITRFTKKTVHVSTAIFDKQSNQEVADIFTQAKVSRDILMFTQADPLFEQRAAVRNPHESDQSFDLNNLQKNIAKHNGIVILVTEKKQALSASMSSKVNVLVRFPITQPSADQ
ncbi:hypothetical protein [Psychromonas sp.]|uniref:hypothetical protein n=1 Tax=Psychromonas sp. TaxID=1884585 RepID=UPI0035663543